MDFLRDPPFLPQSNLAGVGIFLLVLALALPPTQVIGLVAGTALMVGLVLARLRREAEEGEPVRRAVPIRARG